MFASASSAASKPTLKQGRLYVQNVETNSSNACIYASFSVVFCMFRETKILTRCALLKEKGNFKGAYEWPQVEPYLPQIVTTSNMSTLKRTRQLKVVS